MQSVSTAPWEESGLRELTISLRSSPILRLRLSFEVAEVCFRDPGVCSECNERSLSAEKIFLISKLLILMLHLNWSIFRKFIFYDTIISAKNKSLFWNFSLLKQLFSISFLCVTTRLPQFTFYGLLPLARATVQIHINAQGHVEAMSLTGHRYFVEKVSLYGYWFSIWSVIGLNTAQRYTIVVFGILPNIEALLSTPEL